jgi:hypothetical protein
MRPACRVIDERMKEMNAWCIGSAFFSYLSCVVCESYVSSYTAVVIFGASTYDAIVARSAELHPSDILSDV